MNTKERKRKWDLRFLRLAHMVSTWSKDPSTQCGAVITDRDHKLISVGFNGFPQHVTDHKEWLDDRPTKYQIILHAEENAILMAGPLFDATLYTTGHTCAKCTSVALQAGIRRFVSYERPELEEREQWKANMKLARDLIMDHREDPELIRIPHDEVFNA